MTFVGFVSDFLCAWTSYSVALCFSHPLDTIRIRHQTLGRSTLVTLRQDGLRSLYAGLGTPMIANGPIVAWTFALNEFYRAALRQARVSLWDPQAANERHFSHAELAIAGGLAGMTSSLVQCPCALIRIQQQTAAVQGQAPISTRHVVLKIFADYGVRGFYRAWTLEALSNGVGRMVYFLCYEVFKAQLALVFGAEGESRLDGNGEAATASTWIRLGPTQQKVLAAMMTSTLGWLSIFPFDVVKNKLQGDRGILSAVGQLPQQHRFQYAGAMDCAKQTLRRHGWRGFWVGFPVTVMKSLASSGASLPLFDLMKPAFRSKLIEIYPDAS